MRQDFLTLYKTRQEQQRADCFFRESHESLGGNRESWAAFVWTRKCAGNLIHFLLDDKLLGHHAWKITLFSLSTFVLFYLRCGMFG